MKKYPDISHYSYTKNNPIYFVDIGGRDVGVSIDKVNGTITFSNTIYLVGKTIKTPAELQKVFDQNVKSHMTGTYKDENGKVWKVQTQLTFKKGTEADVKRISASKVPIAESYAIVKPESDKDASSVGEPGGNRIDMAYSMTGDASLVGHENVHNWGLVDKYYKAVIVDDKKHSMKFKSNNKEANILITEKKYEGDILGGYYKINSDGTIVPDQTVSLTQNTINTMASTALKQSNERYGAANFVMEGEIEKTGYTPRVPLNYSDTPADVKATIDNKGNHK